MGEENAAMCTDKILHNIVYMRCVVRNCKGEDDPEHTLYFYPIRCANHKVSPQMIQNMGTLEVLCLEAIAVYISELFSWLYKMDAKDPGTKELVTLVIKHLQLVTQSIPPLLANRFTSIVLKTLTTHTAFVKEECHLDLQKKLLSVVLHPSVTSLHLPAMPVDFEEYTYDKLFGTALTKVETLRLEHCFSSSLHRLACLPHLQTIIFHSFCTDYFLDNLWQCCGQKLRKLDIAYSGAVTAESIMSIHKLQCLEELNITRTSIEGSKFQRLAYGIAGGTLPPTLQKISCGSLYVSDLNVLTEGNFPILRELCVEKLVPNKPIDKHIGNLRRLVLSFSALTHELLSLVGITLTELHLVRVTNLDARVLIFQCPNLCHLEVKMCRHVVMCYEEDVSKGSIETKLDSLKHLHLDTHYLLADVIFVQCGKNIEHLTVIAEKLEEEAMDTFLTMLTEVPQKLLSVSFRSFKQDGLLTTDVVHKLMQSCSSLELVEGISSYKEASRLQRMNPSIHFTP